MLSLNYIIHVRSRLFVEWLSEAAMCAGIPSFIFSGHEVDIVNGNLNSVTAKSQKTSRFASYGRRPQSRRDRGSIPFSSKIAQYLAMIYNTVDLRNIARHVTFHCLTPLFIKVFCALCTSVLDEHVWRMTYEHVIS